MTASLSLQDDNSGPVYANSNINLSPQTVMAGAQTTVTVTVYSTGDESVTLVHMDAFICPGNVVNDATWAEITANPMTPTGSLTTPSIIPAAQSRSFSNLSWTPADAGHYCIIVSAVANGQIFNPDPTTPWSDLWNDPHTAWHNVTVQTVSVFDPVPPPIFGLEASGEADTASPKNRTLRIPLHADPAATRNATLVTRRVPSSEYASSDAAAIDSESAFGLNVDESGGQQGMIGSYSTEIVNLEIAVPTDVKAGTQAAFDISTERDGVVLNGYRVILKFV